MIHLLIVDDHAIVRKGLKQIFTLVTDIVVAGEAADGAAALSQLKAGGIDLILLDLTMPGISGDDLVARMHTRYPQIPILVLSMHNEPQIAERAVKAGARGYLSKDHEPEVLLSAIRKLASGGRYMDQHIAERIAFQVSGADPGSPHDSLTDREFQILRLLARGMTGKQIATELCISSKTVSTHKARLMEKMGFSSSVALYRYAMENHLLY
jgi:DNA-binding NarL/FixJ family response regulator